MTAQRIVTYLTGATCLLFATAWLGCSDDDKGGGAAGTSVPIVCKACGHEFTVDKDTFDRRSRTAQHRRTPLKFMCPKCNESEDVPVTPVQPAPPGGQGGS